MSPLVLSGASRNDRVDLGFVEAKYCHNNEEDGHGAFMLSEGKGFWKRLGGIEERRGRVMC